MKILQKILKVMSFLTDPIDADSAPVEADQQKTATQANVSPILAPSEELHLLNAMEASAIPNFEVDGQNENKMIDDDGFGSNENGGQQNDGNDQQQLKVSANKFLVQEEGTEEKEEEKEEEEEEEEKEEEKEEEEQKQQQEGTSSTEGFADQLKELQNDQQKLENFVVQRILELQNVQQQQQTELCAKIFALEKNTNNRLDNIFEQISLFGKRLPQNCWDASKSHCGLTIYGPNNLTVIYKGNGDGLRSVFAKHSILYSSGADFSDIFYFEISVKNMKDWTFIGIAGKQQTPLRKSIQYRNGTYAYDNDGNIWINGSPKHGNEHFGIGDTIGCGVNLGTKHLFFTKNGRRMGLTNLSICSSSSFMEQLFPFITLWDNGDKIEANFGPNFKFNLAIHC